MDKFNNSRINIGFRIFTDLPRLAYVAYNNYQNIFCILHPFSRYEQRLLTNCGKLNHQNDS